MKELALNPCGQLQEIEVPELWQRRALLTSTAVTIRRHRDNQLHRSVTLIHATESSNGRLPLLRTAAKSCPRAGLPRLQPSVVESNGLLCSWLVADTADPAALHQIVLGQQQVLGLVRRQDVCFDAVPVRETPPTDRTLKLGLDTTLVLGVAAEVAAGGVPTAAAGAGKQARRPPAAAPLQNCICNIEHDGSERRHVGASQSGRHTGRTHGARTAADNRHNKAPRNLLRRRLSNQRDHYSDTTTNRKLAIFLQGPGKHTHSDQACMSRCSVVKGLDG